MLVAIALAIVLIVWERRVVFQFRPSHLIPALIQTVAVHVLVVVLAGGHQSSPGDRVADRDRVCGRCHRFVAERGDMARGVRAVAHRSQCQSLRLVYGRRGGRRDRRRGGQSDVHSTWWATRIQSLRRWADVCRLPLAILVCLCVRRCVSHVGHAAEHRRGHPTAVIDSADSLSDSSHFPGSGPGAAIVLSRTRRRPSRDFCSRLRCSPRTRPPFLEHQSGNSCSERSSVLPPWGSRTSWCIAERRTISRRYSQMPIANALVPWFDAIGETRLARGFSFLGPRWNLAHVALWMWFAVPDIAATKPSQFLIAPHADYVIPLVNYRDDGLPRCEDNPTFCRPFTFAQEIAGWVELRRGRDIPRT